MERAITTPDIAAYFLHCIRQNKEIVTSFKLANGARSHRIDSIVPMKQVQKGKAKKQQGRENTSVQIILCRCLDFVIYYLSDLSVLCIARDRLIMTPYSQITFISILTTS